MWKVLYGAAEDRDNHQEKKHSKEIIYIYLCVCVPVPACVCLRVCACVCPCLVFFDEVSFFFLSYVQHKCNEYKKPPEHLLI